MTMTVDVSLCVFSLLIPAPQQQNFMAANGTVYIMPKITPGLFLPQISQKFICNFLNNPDETTKAKK